MSNQTIGAAYLSDPRLKEAQDLIKQTLKDHSAQITEVRPAREELKKDYAHMLEEFSQLRGGKLFFDYIGSGIGNGALVELCDGSVKYDFITGIGVHYFGHSHPDVVAAQVLGSAMNTTMSGNLQQNADSPKLFKLILDQANKYGAGFDHLFMTSSGVMTAENALKMAFQKRAPAHRVIAFEKCFMGRTIAVSQITDKAAYRKGLPPALSVDYIPFYDEKDHQGSIKRATDMLEKYFERHPGDYAAMCMELIQGEGGYFVGHEEFFKAICDTCKKHDVSVIVDEVQTFMRTTELFAFQYFKLDKHVDFVNIGKNSQVCATLYRNDHKPEPGLISQTFTSSGSAINAAYYMISEVASNGFLGKGGKIEKIHERFRKNLEELAKKYPKAIKGPWGLGTMIGMTVFEGDAQKSKDFTMKLYDNGVMGFIAGAKPTRVRFLVPAGAICMDDIDKVCEILEKTLLEMM